jgi:spore maturation protein CgeB
MDYGQFDAVQYDKKYIPEATWILEAGDCPQAARMHLSKAVKSDIVLVPDKQTVEWYRSMNINAYFWTHHADTNIFKPYNDESIKYDCVTTCGPRGNGLTDAIKKELGDAFFNERYFWGEEYGRLLNRGKIVFQCSQFKEITRRIFEGMACGKMVITDRLPKETGLEELFIDGRDIVYYNDAKDAIDKIKYYAEHDEEREIIAANGFRKTVESHSVRARIDEFERLINDQLN